MVGTATPCSASSLALSSGILVKIGCNPRMRLSLYTLFQTLCTWELLSRSGRATRAAPMTRVPRTLDVLFRIRDTAKIIQLLLRPIAFEYQLGTAGIIPSTIQLSTNKTYPIILPCLSR